MSKRNLVDIAIIGAGPAGVCAALRLQQLGYRVQLIERSAIWPRPQIGEALTPGIKNIIELLDANTVLENVPLLTRLPTRLCWRSRTPELVNHQDAAIVDRGAFDAALLNLARARGILVAQPGQVSSIHGSAGDWRLQLQTPDGAQEVQARFILEAHGRAKGSTKGSTKGSAKGSTSGTTSGSKKGNENGSVQQLACAPRLIALWGELEKPDVPPIMTNLTQVEALEHGWLWSSSLPGQRLRVMLLCDPASLRRFAPGDPLRWLRQQCGQSQLFATVANAPFFAVKACSATPYMDCGSWQEGRLKVGDAAFALDPVSSSGVEKAMRFSLQAVVAIHTSIDTLGQTTADVANIVNPQTLARDFFQHRLIETCARHTLWTRGYYAQAWCADQPFWQERATPFAALFAPDSNLDVAARAMLIALQHEMATLDSFQSAQITQLATSPPSTPRALPILRLQQQIGLHETVQIVDMPCVVADRVQLCRAFSHPQLERPLAFLENEALLPPLEILRHHPTLATVLDVLGQTMAQAKAQRLLGWLWQRGLLEALPMKI
jgi:hypothetical protein